MTCRLRHLYERISRLRDFKSSASEIGFQHHREVRVPRVEDWAAACLLDAHDKLRVFGLRVRDLHHGDFQRGCYALLVTLPRFKGLVGTAQRFPTEHPVGDAVALPLRPAVAVLVFHETYLAEVCRSVRKLVGGRNWRQQLGAVRLVRGHTLQLEHVFPLIGLLYGGLAVHGVCREVEALGLLQDVTDEGELRPPGRGVKEEGEAEGLAQRADEVGVGHVGDVIAVAQPVGETVIDLAVGRHVSCYRHALEILDYQPLAVTADFLHHPPAFG